MQAQHRTRFLSVCVCVYLSSDALSSNTASLKLAPSSCRATARMLVVLPVPGGPYKNQEGRIGCHAQASSSQAPAETLLLQRGMCVMQRPRAVCTGSCMHAGGLLLLAVLDVGDTHRQDDIRHVALLCYDLQAGDSLHIAHDVLHQLGPILFHLRAGSRWGQKRSLWCGPASQQALPTQQPTQGRS